LAILKKLRETNADYKKDLSSNIIDNEWVFVNIAPYFTFSQENS